jgi:SAM-dependent methyltransferase
VPRAVYSREFFEALPRTSTPSAEVIVPYLCELLEPRSVVDVGCGVGAFLEQFVKCGVGDYLGIDSRHVHRDALRFPEGHLLVHDLSQPLTLDRQFELVVCLEVAEHIPAASASTFVESLTRLGAMVLFSAAIPGQGGDGHLNEQWPNYWAETFTRYGYVAADVLRSVIWDNEAVAYWYAQNSLLYVRPEVLETNQALAGAVREKPAMPLAVVHPRFYATLNDPHEVARRVRPAVRTLVQRRSERLRRALTRTRVGGGT